MTQWTSPRVGVLPILAIERVRESLHLIRIAAGLMIVLSGAGILIHIAPYVRAWTSMTIPSSSLMPVVIGFLSLAAWVLAAIAVVRLRTIGAGANTWLLDVIAGIVVAVQLVLVVFWFRAFVVLADLQIASVTMSEGWWWAGALTLVVVSTLILGSGRRLDESLPEIRTGFVIVLGVLAGWWLSDLAVRGRGGLDAVLIPVMLWVRRVMPAILTVSLGWFAYRINARLYGRLCTERTFIVTLVVALGYAAGVYFFPGLDMPLPVLAFPFAVWVMVAVRHARRRLLSHGVCLECGYDLTGIDAERCPECGHAVEPGPIVKVTA